MKKRIPVHIPHDTLSEQLEVMVGQSVTEINDHWDLMRPHYTGVHEARFADGSAFYVKNSDGLERNPFAFPDLPTAYDHVGIYEILKDKRFFHPDSKFVLTECEDGYRLIYASPAMDSTTNVQRRLNRFPRDLLPGRIEILNEVLPHDHRSFDTGCMNNYGMINGELFYFDMHLFDRVPSSLFHYQKRPQVPHLHHVVPKK
ncbi:hypothetical protein ACFLZX_03455 [Nanoarchaeota archaeon]